MSGASYYKRSQQAMPAKYILTEDVQSKSKSKKIYGRKGDVVELVALHGEVAIVRNSREAFSVHYKKLIKSNVQ